MLVQWHDDFDTGQAAADDEHRGVINILNELDVCLAVDAPAIVVDRTLTRLTDAVDDHFRHEEAGWTIADPAHQAEHDELLGRVLQLHDDWHAGARILDHRTLTALARWWLTHVRSHDAGEGALFH